VKNLVYRKYLLAILLLLMVFNYLERYALGLLMQDIKSDLALSDMQLGMLTGIAFAAFYSILGIPIARWADRGDRITIVSLAAALSGAAVALCGLARSFAQLLLIRIGVAAGEAGCLPPALSLIADHFDRSERPRAVAIYKLGAPLAGIVGYLTAGWLNARYGWRTTFVVLGLPGLVLAILARVTLADARVRDAVLTRKGGRSASSVSASSVRVVFQTLWANSTFRHLLLGYSVAAFFGYGIVQWKAAFFMRSYGLGSAELGVWFAAIAGGGGLLGTYLGGALAARYAARNEHLQLKVIAIGYAVFCVISAGMYLSLDPYWAFALMGISIVGISAMTAPLFAAIQTLIPQHMRAVAIALVLFASNMIGMGLGPLAAGALSDALRPWAGEESLRYALLTLCSGYLWCAWHFARASRTVAWDVAALPDGGE
jgi:MFS family permease